MKPGNVPGPDNFHPEFFYASSQSVPHMVNHTVLYMPQPEKRAQNLDIFEGCCYPEAK